MSLLVEQTFNKWIENLDPISARITIFKKIRDISYEMKEVKSSDELLQKNAGSCTPKHFLLGRMFENLGIFVKYVTYPFTFVDQKLNYPKDLDKIIKIIPPFYHLAMPPHDLWTLVSPTSNLL